MCLHKSLIVTKDRIYGYVMVDNHTDILAAAGLKDTALPPQHIKVEVLPPTRSLEDIRDLARWSIKLDQDILPDWYVAPVDETRIREWMRDNYKMITEDAYVVVGPVDCIAAHVGRLLVGCALVAPGATITYAIRATITYAIGATINYASGAEITDASGATIGDARGATIGDVSYATIGDASYATIGDASYATIGDARWAKITYASCAKIGDARWAKIEGILIESGGWPQVKD